MIQEGQRKKARYWGAFKVKKVAKLAQPVICNSEETGEAEFMPTIVQIEWEKAPSSDVNEYWLPYWVKIRGKEKYGQFAPMLGSKALLQLLQDAIRQGFFSKEFMLGLSETLREKLNDS